MSSEEDYEPTQQEVDEALHECARYGDLEDLKEMKSTDDTNMLNFNAVDAAGNCALHKAAANGHIEMLTYLKENGTKYILNKTGVGPITWAILNQLAPTVQWFVDNYHDDIDVLLKPEFGLSPLSTAHDLIAHDIVDILLKHPSSKALEDKNLEVEDDSDEDDEDDEAVAQNEENKDTEAQTDESFTQTESKDDESIAKGVKDDVKPE